MKRTKLVVLTVLTMVAIMLFTACGGGFNKKLDDTKAMNLVDSYDLSAFDGDFALKMEVGMKAEGVDLSASLDAQFKRTANLYNAYLKINAGALGQLMETSGSGDGPEALLNNGEVWLSNDKLFIKGGDIKGYVALPEEITSLSLQSSDFNFVKILEKVFVTTGLEIELFKSDGTIDWDTLLEEIGAPKDAIDEIKDIIDLSPIDSKGELQLSKFFKNFTTYNISYDKNSKRNIIDANLDFDKLVEKFKALGQALNDPFPEEAEEILTALKKVNIKFVLGEKYFESIEVNLNLSDLGMPLDGFEGFTVNVKLTYTFAPQTITIPNIDSTWTDLEE